MSTHETSKSADGKPLGPRARKRLERTAVILAEASRLVTEGGLEALTVHALADRVHVTVGALYRYFDSKAAIVAALEVEAVRAAASQVRDGLAAMDAWLDAEPPEQAHVAALAPLVAAGMAYRRFARQAPSHFRLLSLVMAEPQNLLDAAKASDVFSPLIELLQLLGSRFDRAVEAGALASGDVLDRTVLFWLGLRSVLQAEKLGTFMPNRFDGDRLGPAMADALLLAWGADPEALRQARAVAVACRAPLDGGELGGDEPRPAAADAQTTP